MRKLTTILIGLATLAAPSVALAESPMVPTGNLAGNQRRPYRILISDIGKVVRGDRGDALLAGVTRYKRLAPTRSYRLSNFGRLHWTAWNGSGGQASGALWLDTCSPTCAGGTYRPIKSTIHVYRPNGLGIFTRMTVHAGRYNGTVSAIRSAGVWLWQ